MSETQAASLFPLRTALSQQDDRTPFQENSVVCQGEARRQARVRVMKAALLNRVIAACEV